MRDKNTLKFWMKKDIKDLGKLLWELRYDEGLYETRDRLLTDTEDEDLADEKIERMKEGFFKDVIYEINGKSLIPSLVSMLQEDIRKRNFGSIKEGLGDNS